MGAGNYNAIGAIFQRAVLFIFVHTLPMVALFLALPSLLRALGYPADLAQHVGAYLRALLPGVWVDMFWRWGGWAAQ